MAICDACSACTQGTREKYGTDTINDWGQEGGFVYHHRCTSSLLAAVENECRICCTLWDQCTPATRAIVAWCNDLDHESPFITCGIQSFDFVIKGKEVIGKPADSYLLILHWANEIAD